MDAAAHPKRKRGDWVPVHAQLQNMLNAKVDLLEENIEAKNLAGKVIEKAMFDWMEKVNKLEFRDEASITLAYRKAHELIHVMHAAVTLSEYPATIHGEAKP